MDADAKLACLLSDFARTVVTDFPVQAVLDQLIGQIVDVLSVSAAGVTLLSESNPPRYVAASDASAMAFEQLQVDLAEGPCIDAYATGAAVSVPCLREERRFPRFTPRAIDQGLEAVFTFPLHHGAVRLGALDVYRAEAGPMARSTMSVGQTLADVTAAYLLNAEARAQLEVVTERARQSSLHDALTGLPNRTLLVERLHQAIVRGRRTGRSTGVVCVDLDLFKLVNGSYGHDAGDHLLIAFGERLTGQLRASDTVARIAGDEFVIMREDLDDPREVTDIAARLEHALSQRFVLPEADVKITVSVGIALTDRASDTEQTLRDAEAAMRRAKRQGAGRAA